MSALFYLYLCGRNAAEWLIDMKRVRITKKTMPGRHWLMYVNEEGVVKNIDLSGCANNFSHATGYVSGDDLQAVGWRYEENGQLCYELFNIGHTIFFIPVRANPVRLLGFWLQRKNPQKAYRDYLENFETALNRGGWKTVMRKEGY